jgi:hypothetical protein
MPPPSCKPKFEFATRAPRIGIERACLVEVGAGLGQGASIEILLAAIEIRNHVLGIEPDRLVVVGDGAVIVALGSVRIAPVVVGLDIFGIEPDRLVVQSLSPLSWYAMPRLT